MNLFDGGYPMRDDHIDTDEEYDRFTVNLYVSAEITEREPVTGETINTTETDVMVKVAEDMRVEGIAGTIIDMGGWSVESRRAENELRRLIGEMEDDR